MKQDTTKLRKKIANMSREISIRDSKLRNMKTQLQAKEDLIIALRAKEIDHMNLIEELTELVPPEVLAKKQAEWRQKTPIVGVLRT